jgi:hypothetical protein
MGSYRARGSGSVSAGSTHGIWNKWWVDADLRGRRLIEEGGRSLSATSAAEPPGAGTRREFVQANAGCELCAVDEAFRAIRRYPAAPKVMWVVEGARHQDFLKYEARGYDAHVVEFLMETLGTTRDVGAGR